jgi:hypothetical protein
LRAVFPTLIFVSGCGLVGFATGQYHLSATDLLGRIDALWDNRGARGGLTLDHASMWLLVTGFAGMMMAFSGLVRILKMPDEGFETGIGAERAAADPEMLMADAPLTIDTRESWSREVYEAADRIEREAVRWDSGASFPTPDFLLSAMRVLLVAGAISVIAVYMGNSVVAGWAVHKVFQQQMLPDGGFERLRQNLNGELGADIYGLRNSLGQRPTEFPNDRGWNHTPD